MGKDYFKGKIFTADTSYHCDKNLEKCQEEDLDAYIPDYLFRRRNPLQDQKKVRLAKKFLLEDFRYRKDTDVYICPNGKNLTLFAKRSVRDRNIYKVYKADNKDCAYCPLRSECLNLGSSKSRNLNVPIGSLHTNLTKKMAKKIDSKLGRQIYPRRFAVVEPVFANIRVQKRLDRFTYRGKTKVTIQWLLYCIVHNMEKIANFGFA